MNAVIVKKILFLNILILLFSFQLTAQETYTAEKRASYILYITNNVTWAEDFEYNEFTIGVFDAEGKLFETLQNKVNTVKTIKDKPAKVLLFKNLSDIVPVRVLYVHYSSGISLADILQKTSGNKTLIVSEKYDFEESMIMLVEADGRRAYTVNVELIEKEGLTISKLFVASAIKTRRQWEEESNNAKSLLSEQNRKVKEQRKEIDEQQAKIDKQKKQMGKLSKDIELQQKNLTQKQTELIAQEKQIIQQKTVLNNLQSEVQNQEDKINKQLAKIETQQLLIYVFFAFLLVVSGMVFFIYRGYKIKKQANKMLAEKNEAITQQNVFISQQRDHIAEQNKEITDSILYASRIQTAILPPISIIKDALPEHFILYKPRDIVSGDYYWVREIGDKLIIAAADCTGHGVPGAFMSVLGVSLLNEIVTKMHTINAAEILNQLRELVIQSLHQKGEIGETKDGMDMALCVIDKKTLIISFAGAYNPLFIFRPGEAVNVEETDSCKIQAFDTCTLIEAKANRMPIGIYFKMRAFEATDIQLMKGDTFYIFSDGYIDQFGGESNEKLMSKNFKRLLSTIQNQSLTEQKQSLEDHFQKWRGTNDQLDDIVVIGVRV